MSLLESSTSRARFRQRLLAWFDQHRRNLPWRRKRPSLYQIWVSEVMLQQTQVVTVLDYYGRFMKRFPTVSKLAAADQQQVLRLWEGLGYYRRALQMHRAAKTIMAEYNGRFPTDIESVRSLPGIGRYTAAAILSIAKDQRHPIVEGNTMRLYCRLFGYPADPRTSDGQRSMWEFADRLLGRKRPGDTNQALMELGSLVCTQRAPQCHECPVERFCVARAEAITDRLPAKSSKKIEYESRQEAAVVICKRKRYLLRRCGERQRWQGLWDFPRFNVTGEADLGRTLSRQVKRLTGLCIDPGPPRKTMQHGVTRFRIELTCFVAEKATGTIPESRLGKNGDGHLRWATKSELRELPLNVTGRKIAQWVTDPGAPA